MIRNAAVRLSMRSMEEEACPTLIIHDLVECGIEDHKVREIRDDIEQMVRQLAVDLVKNSQHTKL